MSQSPNSELTERGFAQAQELRDFFASERIDRVISSPYLRAIQTIQPLAEQKNVEIQLDGRLKERVLSSSPLPDWMEKLADTFNDLDLVFEGGESSNQAMNRIVDVVEEMIDNNNFKTTVIVAHGGIISLLLHHFDNSFGFDEWKSLSNPDVYLLRMMKNRAYFERLWKD